MRYPIALVFGGALSYALNLAVFRKMQKSDYEELGLLDKYLTLDLNADMMRKDLEEQYAIKVKAKYFDLE